MSKLVVVYRSYGHTKLQAEAVQKGAAAVEGPGPDTHNRVGSFIGPMAASFQVNPPDAPSKGDIETAELYGKRVAEIVLQFARGK